MGRLQYCSGSHLPRLLGMTRRLPCSVALVVALGLGAVVGVSASPVNAAVAPPPPKTVDTWAWCGVNPDDPVAAAAVYALANAGGIDATFGPCNIPTPPYTPADTSNRYVPPDVYMRLVQLNATVGMKTIVYDKRFWSTTAGSQRGDRLLDARARQHRRVGHGRRVRPGQAGMADPDLAVDDHAQRRRAGDRCEAVRQPLADHTRPGAWRTCRVRNGCCRSPSTTAISAPAWPAPSTHEPR